MKAPERIWAIVGYDVSDSEGMRVCTGEFSTVRGQRYGTEAEYIRADLVPQWRLIESDELAKALHFDFCDQMGWPNGQPIWDELPDKTRLAADALSKAMWRSLADCALEIFAPTPQEEG